MLCKINYNDNEEGMVQTTRRRLYVIHDDDAERTERLVILLL